jgi:hypothetical protein
MEGNGERVSEAFLHNKEFQELANAAACESHFLDEVHKGTAKMSGERLFS